ncbi:unnamed protein product [Parnassius apollo]|uniref:(apollo) hypothetical protein n=1 Tax=Parnassius apollo TaxID=110799 RepID=A0A8S3YD28_PARAO|nr:unnamed protein product [Parnassius apollo]
MKKHYANIEVILKWSNATPIRKRGGIGYVCCYCSEECADPAQLKKHTIYQHKGTSIYKASFASRRELKAFYVKLDITSLRCDICGHNVNTLEDIIDHLKTTHNIFMHTDIIHQWIPFKFESETLRCYICSSEFSRFKMLLEHMHKHFRNFICDICESGYVNLKQLMTHLTCHTTGSFQCDYCSKTFNTLKKKKSHEKSVHTHPNEMRNKCGFCAETFKSFHQKENHLKEVHGISSEVRCQACNKTFAKPKSYGIHVRRDHLMERRHACNECDMKFFSNYDLKFHKMTHSKIKKFQCGICSKFYVRKTTLREHMRIHADDRRYKCEHCGRAFVQKCSWRGHMLTKHGERV